MKPYLVRVAGTRDLVGIFVAKDQEQLASLVDECAEIELCEFITLSAGGIFWPEKSVPIPAAVAADNVAPLPWPHCEPTERWWSALHEPQLGWQPIASARQQAAH